MTSLRIVEHIFTPADLVGGSLALDFVNTGAGRNLDPRDWVDSYQRFVDWAALTGEFDESALSALATTARQERRSADEALARARALREALHEIFSAQVDGAVPSRKSVDALQSFWHRAEAITNLRWHDGRLVRELDARKAGLDLIACTVAGAATDLLTEGRSGVLKRCGGTNCGWLFLDTSKNGRRRWCDMSTCGNAAKARRHYARVRSAQDSSSRITRTPS